MTDDDKRIAELKAELEEIQARKAAADAAPREAEASPAPFSKPARAKDNNTTGKVIAGVIVVGLGAWFISTVNSAPSNPAATPASPVAIVEPVVDPATLTPWSYSEDTDALTDKVTKTACTTSSNKVQLDWPYQPVSAQLCIRQSPRFGLDTFVQLNGDGQILCRSYEDCTLKVRFGEAPARNWPGVGAADGSSNVVFLRRSESLATQAKDVDQIIVELPLYEAGNQPIIFPTQKLEWPRP